MYSTYPVRLQYDTSVLRIVFIMRTRCNICMRSRTSGLPPPTRREGLWQYSIECIAGPTRSGAICSISIYRDLIPPAFRGAHRRMNKMGNPPINSTYIYNARLGACPEQLSPGNLETAELAATASIRWSTWSIDARLFSYILPRYRWSWRNVSAHSI